MLSATVGNQRGRILVCISTYNEADNISALIAEIRQRLPEESILVIDDGSPDGTGEIVEKLMQNDDLLHVAHRPRKLGLGSAHKLAMKYAVRHEYDHLITMDADFSHHPKYLQRMVQMLPYHDFVIGSRYVEGGHCEYTGTRALISKTANLLAKRLLGITLKECTTAYRGFNVKTLGKLNIDKIRSNGYSFFVESLYLISRCTDQLAEFPIYFEDRRAGTSKISKIEIFNGVRTLLRLFFQRLLRPNAVQEFRVLEDNHVYAFRSRCVNCHSLYQSELFPERNQEATKTVSYRCTSQGHRSHGRIAECLTCGLIYTDPQLPAKTVENMYTEVMDASYVEHASARYRTFSYNLDKIQKHLPPKGKLLDVGSYCGLFLKVAEKRGYESLGVEPSKWAVEYANKELGVKAEQGTVETLRASARDFDVVTLWDVLEHFSDPAKELEHIHERLRPGGVLAFSTLNIKNWFPKLMGERWPWMMDMHLYYFNDEVVEDMLRKRGFKLISTNKYCHIISADYFLHKLESLGIWGAKYLKRLGNLRWVQSLYIPFRFGDIQLYVCQKV